MKVKSRIHCNLLLAAFCLLSGWGLTAQAEMVTLRATLILANDRSAALDRRIEHVEYKLRRIFGFEHYHFKDQQSLNVNSPGSASTMLAGGYQLRVEFQPEGTYRALVTWSKGGEVLVRTRLTLSKSTPAILGGPRTADGSLILALDITSF